MQFLYTTGAAGTAGTAMPFGNGTGNVQYDLDSEFLLKLDRAKEETQQKAVEEGWPLPADPLQAAPEVVPIHVEGE